MESRGNVQYPYGNVSNVGSTLHWGPHYTMDPFKLTHAEAIVEDTKFAEEFHTYGKFYQEPIEMDSPL